MMFDHYLVRYARLAAFFSLGGFVHCISVPDTNRSATVPTEDMAATDPGTMDLHTSAELPPDFAQSYDLRLPSSDSSVPSDLSPTSACIQVAAATAYRPALMRVSAATFLMGSSTLDPNHRADEPQHLVTITKSYYMAETEITQLQFNNVRGYIRTSFVGDSLPVHNVQWLEAALYSNQLSDREGRTRCYLIYIDSVTGLWTISVNKSCSGYRLPTEAEWEMAARGGQFTAYSGSDNADVVATYKSNSSGAPTPVKSRLPNTLCIYDLSGNMDEWVEDPYRADYGGVGDVTDPRGSMTFYQDAVLRGGNFEDTAPGLRVAVRSQAAPDTISKDVGFRVVRTAD